MKITKIQEKIELDEQFDLEPQGCLNDCTEFSGKYSGDAIKQAQWIAGGGTKQSWIDTVGMWCSKKMTAKWTSWW